MTRVPVHPEMLRWACERAGYDVHDLAPRFPQLPEWERGEKLPTFKQLEAFAKATHTPFGFLFLPEPPEERLPIPDFRTLKGRPARPSPDLLDTIYAMQRRQDWLREERIEGEADPLDLVGSARLNDDPSFYNNQNTRVGVAFATRVIRAAKEGRLSFKDAYDLTGLRGGTFQEYARHLGFNLPGPSDPTAKETSC
jgi:transcriptional regulator with XRE-family HTH domain